MNSKLCTDTSVNTDLLALEIIEGSVTLTLATSTQNMSNVLNSFFHVDLTIFKVAVNDSDSV